MRPITPWLWGGIGLGLAAVAIGPLTAGPGPWTGFAAEWPVIALLAAAPLASLGVDSRKAATLLTSRARALAGLAGVALACTATLASPTAAGPIAAIVAFGLIALLCALCSPNRGRRLARTGNSADPLPAPHAPAGEAPRARAA